MPLSLAEQGKDNRIRKISGSQAQKKQLQAMGCVEGESIKILSTVNGNLIVKIKDCRLAMSEGLAHRIMVDPA